MMSESNPKCSNVGILLHILCWLCVCVYVCVCGNFIPFLYLIPIQNANICLLLLVYSQTNKLFIIYSISIFIFIVNNENSIVNYFWLIMKCLNEYKINNNSICFFFCFRNIFFLFINLIWLSIIRNNSLFLLCFSLITWNIWNKEWLIITICPNDDGVDNYNKQQRFLFCFKLNLYSFNDLQSLSSSSSSHNDRFSNFKPI